MFRAPFGDKLQASMYPLAHGLAYHKVTPLPVLSRYVGQAKKIERFRLVALSRPATAKAYQPGLRLVHAQSVFRKAGFKHGS